jgi:hypothetical protein
VPPRGGRRRYVFTPDPAGTRWYHSHGDGRNLKRSTYGQFGLVIVESMRSRCLRPRCPSCCTGAALHGEGPSTSSSATSRSTAACWVQRASSCAAGQRAYSASNASATLASSRAPGHPFMLSRSTAISAASQAGADRVARASERAWTRSSR